MKFIFALLALAAVANAASVNPIRHVVSLLQKMVSEIEAEGKKEAKAYEKFMCYCEGNNKDLQASLESGTEEIAQLKADIEAKSGRRSQLLAEIKEHKDSRAAAKEAVASATAIRDKDRAEFEATNGDFVQNVKALGNAISALSKGMGSFLQTPEAGALKQIVLKAANVEDDDRQTVVAFLAGGSPYGDYQASGGEIVGILKQMKDQMTKDQGEGAQQEADAEKQFNDLSAAKKAEIAAATEAIEKKSEEQGKLAVEVAEAKGELSDTQKELGANQQFLANMDEMCKTKTAEWEERSKLRNEELVALADTIKMLNDDDALDIFKSQLSGPATSNMQTSFLQRSSSRDIRREAVQILGQHKQVQVALIANLLKSGGGFDKVIALIDTLMGELKTEQNDDDEQLKWCNKEFDATSDSIKGVVRELEGLNSNIEKQKADNDAFSSTIKATQESIKNLDKAVAEATEQRKEDNAEYTSNKAMNTAAHQLLGMAKNRLNKFYNPKLYKPPPQRELTEEERIMQANGMDIGTVAPTTVAGTNIQAVPYFLQTSIRGQAPPPPPETWGEHKSHSGSTGVIGLMDKLINELESDMKQADLDENTAQEEYTKLMQESADKRKADAGVLTDAESNLANGEANLQQLKSDRSTKNDELTALKEYDTQLHSQCDFLTKNYDLRKDARAREAEALQNAKAVLKGASYQ